MTITIDKIMTITIDYYYYYNVTNLLYRFLHDIFFNNIVDKLKNLKTENLSSTTDDNNVVS